MVEQDDSGDDQSDEPRAVPSALFSRGIDARLRLRLRPAGAVSAAQAAARTGLVPTTRAAGRLAGRVVRATKSAATALRAVGPPTVYALRTFGAPAWVRGLAVESACCATHLATYPLGLLRERPGSVHQHYRTDALTPEQRGLLVSDLTSGTDTAGTPILLLHGFLDNRSVFAVFRRALRRRGFGVVQALNYSLLTGLNGDVRMAAHELRRHVERLRERTGSDYVHVVGHSLGGVIARYYVQRLGGDRAVHTLVTLGSPHGGSAAAHLLRTRLTRQLTPGSELLAELAEPAPGCRTRFLVVWSRLDLLIVPQRNARIEHPDLSVDTLELGAVGHLSLPIHPRAVQWVASRLANSDPGMQLTTKVTTRRRFGPLSAVPDTPDPTTVTVR